MLYTLEYYSVIKKSSLAICNNMGGPWGNNVKWNKSERERKIPYDFTHMCDLKQKQRNR